MTSMITAGSSRGKCSVPSFGQTVRCPARAGTVGVAAPRAVRVRVVPVRQRHRVRQQPRVAVAQQRARLPQRAWASRPPATRPGAWLLLGRPADAEVGDLVVVDARARTACPPGPRAAETNTSSSRPSRDPTSACESCTTSTRVRGSAQAASIHSVSRAALRRPVHGRSGRARAARAARRQTRRSPAGIAHGPLAGRRGRELFPQVGDRLSAAQQPGKIHILIGCVDPVRVKAHGHEDERRAQDVGQVRLRAAAALLGEQHLAAERPLHGPAGRGHGGRVDRRPAGTDPAAAR